MKKPLYIIILILLSLPLLAGEWNQYYFRFQLSDKSKLQELTNLISIDKVSGHWVYAYANDWEWDEFCQLGYNYNILPAPSSEFPAVMAASKSQMRDWDAYPTYDAYVSMMNSFAANYPHLCKIYNVGTTVSGRSILIAKISDNVNVDENEPEVLFTSTMHGDELTGKMLMLRLIDTLLSQYGSDPRITNIVNNMQLYIGPNTNPDGTYYGGNNTVASARRANQNGYDLNRNYPKPDGSTNTGPIQPETQAMMDFANAHHFVFGVNYHGGEEVVNYPWDFISTTHPDNDWFISSSLVYASNAQNDGLSGYFATLTSNGIVRGSDWYMISGGRQDWMNYTRNGREVTIECSRTKMPSASTMPSYWNYNYNAMLSYLEEALKGIHGTVTDAYGNPLVAEISIAGYDNSYSIVDTNPIHGDFYRYLNPGTYTLTVSTAGYESQNVQVTVSASAATPVNIVFGELPHQQQISLSAGWNLISLNSVPASYSVEDVFSGLSGLLQVKNISKSHLPSVAEHFNTLKTMAVDEGYWVNVSQATMFSITGTEIVASQTPINLKTGWNLISYLPQAPKPTSTALASISPWLQQVDHLGIQPTQMEPGKAYWVKVSQDCTLTYPN
ncbi:MAG: zinc carboxypeptidase [Candidatus Cloacimonetes bacterium]|nr:zinc carboxypeptidase [Candidatus Cloacimonadota bacterium]